MRISRTAFCPLIALSLAASAVAVDKRDLEQAGASNAGYLEAVRGGGLQTDITYLRPSAALPDAGDLAVPWEAASDPSVERRNRVILLCALLVLVAWIFVRYGRGISVSLGRAARDPRDGGPAGQAEAAPAAELPPEAFLKGLARMRDRRRALILLVARALERAAEANGQRLGRSQTARDVLRLVPRRWSHFETLRRLIAEAELVHFGGRDLPEEHWRACLASARPMFMTDGSG